ncbi:MAG: threonylcarbamoyl-AMP synthase, partial [Alphaproteobacteria bacterium]
MTAQEDCAAIAEAARLIRAGELVAFPTETVYGLGGDATNERAVAKIFEAKGRPQFNPLISHVPGSAEAKRLVQWNDMADKLAARFWPGPLTLVLRRAAGSPIALLATAGLDTVAIRAPAHPLAQELIGAAGVPIAAPSANRSGAISPTRAEHVAESLGAKVAMILDGGPCTIGIESTVLDLTSERPTLLRPGGATREAIEAVVGPIAVSEALPAGDAARKSPGQLQSHYAPARPVRLEAAAVAADEGLLAFGPRPLAGARRTLNLSVAGD